MGNLCGKESKDGFDGPGRTLGSAPAPATKASVPAAANAGSSKKRIVGGPPRTLGDSNPGIDPKLAAGAAAEARANKPSTGALQKKLDAQKKLTQEATLRQDAEEKRRRREMDQQAQVHQHR